MYCDYYLYIRGFIYIYEFHYIYNYVYMYIYNYIYIYVYMEFQQLNKKQMNMPKNAIELVFTVNTQNICIQRDGQ